MSIGLSSYRPRRRPARSAGRAAVAAAAASSVELLEGRRLFAMFAVTDDSFVREGAFANTNFGASTALFTQNTAGATREAYLTFDVAAAPAVGTAVLRVDARTQSAATPDQRVAIYAVPTATWVEGNGATSNAAGDGADADDNPSGELTFANRPAASGAPLDIRTVSGDKQQGYPFDVTNYVRAERSAGRTTVSFVIRNLDAGTEFVSYVASEAGDFGPTLEVTTDAGPTATATVSNITPPAGATTDISVTYTDADTVEVLSISPDDLLVLGPDNQPLNVTNAAVTGGASSTSPLTVTYTVAAPGGSWDGDDTGIYSVRLAAGQVADALENVAAPGVLATFNVGDVAPPPGEGPTPQFQSDPVAGGATAHSFRVTYTDTDLVTRSTIGAGNVSVTGPGGQSLTVTGVSVNPDTNGASLVATYTVAAPGGFWNGADNGTYTVTLLANQVKDADGNAAAAGVIGTFTPAIVGDVRQLVGAFGSGTQNPRGLTFTDADGTIITTIITTGQGQVFLENGAYQIELTGTTAASALSIKTKGGNGRVSIGNSSATGGLKSITGKTADLVGAFTTGGILGKATLGNVNGGSLIIGPGGAVALTLGDVTNLSIDSDSAIKSIKANSWSDDGAPDLISAPDFGTLTTKGNFGADIDAAAVKSVKVGGALTGSSIRTAGNVGKVTANGMTASSILAGVNGTALPQSASGFSNAGASIAGITIKGTFSASIIAAPSIGKAALGTVQTTNNGTTFGVAADRAASITATAGTLGPVKLSKLDDPSGSTASGDFVVRIV